MATSSAWDVESYTKNSNGSILHLIVTFPLFPILVSTCMYKSRFSQPYSDKKLTYIVDPQKGL